MEEEQTQSSGFDMQELTRQVTESVSSQLKEELSGVESRIGGRLAPIEERFSPKPEKENLYPGNWDEMSYEDQVRYVSESSKRSVESVKSEMSSRQDSLEAYVAAPKLVDSWDISGPNADIAKKEASDILQDLAFKNPAVIRSLDDSTRQDIIDVATMRASRKAAVVAQDLAQGYQKESVDAEVAKIKDEYRKNFGKEIDDEKAARLAERMKGY